MRNPITISGKTILTAIVRKIRNVMSIAKRHALGLRLDAWFLFQRLAGMAMAQRVAVPVYRRGSAVGVMRRSPVQMRRHLRRVTGRCRGSRSACAARAGF